MDGIIMGIKRTIEETGQNESAAAPFLSLIAPS